MDYKSFLKIIKAAFTRPLPGKAAQYFMAPEGRPQTDIEGLDKTKVRQAGVLALIYNQNGNARLILTERSTYRGVHSGQISLPGGKREPFDVDFKATALRETEEEIAVPSTSIEVLGSLSPLYIPPSNFLVYPFVGTLDKIPEMIPEPKEVNQILSYPIDFLLDESSRKFQKIKLSSGFVMESPAFVLDDVVIWGATAMILGELKAMLK